MKEFNIKWTKNKKIFDDILHDTDEHQAKLRIASLGGKVLSIEEAENKTFESVIIDKKEFGTLAVAIDGYRCMLGSILCKMEQEENCDEWSKQAEDLLKVIEGLDNMAHYLVNNGGR